MASILPKLLFALPITLASLAVPAGPPGRPPPHHDRMPAQPPDLTRLLGVEGDTAVRVDALAEQHHLAMFRMHREQMRARGEQRARFRAELAKILSAEQLARFDALGPPRGRGGEAAEARCPEPAPQAPMARPQIR